MFRKVAIAAALGAMSCVPVYSFAAPAQPMSPPHPFTAGQIESMRSLIDRLAATKPLRSAHIGVSLVQASSGRVLAAREADGEFAPASNFKLLDAASALAYLGPRYRFRTQLFARGAVDQGVLDGDLVFVGGGDPVLTRNDLRDAAAAVAAHGIQTITGSVVVDESFFDRQRYGGGWAWDDFPYYYQPPVQALAVEEGTADIAVAPGKSPGDPVAVQIEANGGAMTVVSHAVTTAARGLDDADCFGSPGATQIQMIGHVPVDAKPDVFKCAVADSAAFAVGALRDVLQQAGVAVGSTPRGATPDDGPLDIEDRGPLPAPATTRYPDAALIWSHESPTVAALIKKMMPPSDNFIADHLFKALPTAALHQRGSFDGGADVERKFIASLGLDPTSIDGGDGSGLSQGDRITPRDITTILRWEWLGPYRDTYVYSLGRPGIDGTVRRHLVGTDSVGRVWAKDGYIWHVSTFSGYAFTRHHGLVVFSIMMNDANGSLAPFHAAQDAIVRTLVDLP